MRPFGQEINIHIPQNGTETVGVFRIIRTNQRRTRYRRRSRAVHDDFDVFNFFGRQRQTVQ